ncbi:cupin domain-containing protein [Acholeplasma equirhinis]|uniref:cupin domain-containing protein n=1 Tax=Acholeplasma equirhinis TaxID=555393 RepID=UPI00197A9BA3|nr:cupin domain-containing protein [Acholeplasma equirhinis]MBN3490224.1 cupin domain-containing protein [Acholeplasma equirhinis]
MYKNIDKSEILILKEQVTYQAHQVSSKTIAQNKHVSITLFSFDKDEEIGLHKSNGDAMVTILDGKAKITIDQTEYFLTEGETIVMPAKINHALYALEPFKMILTVVFPIEN